MKKKKIKYIVFLATLLFLLFQSASAASLEVTYPSIPGAPDINNMDPTQGDLPNFVLYIFFAVVYLSGAIAVVVLAFGALKYFTSAGNVAKMMDARNQIASAIIGLGIMVGSYVILYNINPRLTVLSFQPPEKIPEIKDLKMEDLPQKLQSAIYTEIPLGRILERMFETKKVKNLEESPTPAPSPSPFSCYSPSPTPTPAPKESPTPTPELIPADQKSKEEEDKIPRMQRIDNIASNILKLSEKLRDSNKTLKALSEDCTCSEVNMIEGYSPVECTSTPAPTPVSQTQGTNQKTLTFKSLAQIEGDIDPNFCGLTNYDLQKILDNDKLQFSAGFERVNVQPRILPSPESSPMPTALPTLSGPNCWKETKRDFKKGEGSLQAGSFSTPKIGKAVVDFTLPSSKGYVSFSYKTTARDASCVCGPYKTMVLFEDYFCTMPRWPGLEININGKLLDDGSKLDKIESGSLPHSEEWKTIKVLAEANTRFTFKFSSPIEDPCFYAELDNVEFTPLDPSPSPTPSPVIPSEGCNCDPCKSARSQIIETQHAIVNTISNGTTITQKNDRGYDEEIKTSLMEQHGKAEREIRLLQDEINKLDRMENFMFECGLSNLVTLSDFLDIVDQHAENKWILDTANFWDYIRVKDDWATFFCPVSGTVWEGVDPLKINLQLVKNDLGQKDTDALKQEEVSGRQMGFKGLADYKKILDSTKEEIGVLKKKLEDNRNARPEDRLTDDQVKDINDQLKELEKRKEEIEKNINDGEESLKEINEEIDKANPVISYGFSFRNPLSFKFRKLDALKLLRAELVSLFAPQYATLGALKATLRAKYKDDKEELDKLEAAINQIDYSPANPIGALNQAIDDLEEELAELENTKLEIETGLEGGNIGEENLGDESSLGPLFDDEVAAGCSQEIPVGELIDRSRRVAYKIIERLHKLMSLSEDLMKSTSDMEVLLSQCSSQRCKPTCISPETSPTPTPEASPSPTPNDGIERYQCGNILCENNKLCLSTNSGPSCFPNGEICAGSKNQSICQSGVCIKQKGASSTSCCDTIPCGNWGNQICCPNIGSNSIYNSDTCISKNNEPDCCSYGTETACGNPGNQICCPTGSKCGIGTNNEPFCCYNYLGGGNTATICGEPGHQTCCSSSNYTNYCSGTSTSPSCTTDNSSSAITNSAYTKIQTDVYADPYSWDYESALVIKCGGGKGILKVRPNPWLAYSYELDTRVTWPAPYTPESHVNAPYYIASAFCCESPSNVCGEILYSGGLVQGNKSYGLCCQANQKCVINGGATQCCPDSSVVCGEPASQICCQSNQKCGLPVSSPSDSNPDPYCIDYCPEPPEPAYCSDFNQALNSKNIIWYDEYSGLRDPDSPFWAWKRFNPKGFYNQTAESYEGGSALMASLKHDKLSPSKFYFYGITGAFNVKNSGTIRFSYKTSSYYNPSLTPFTFWCSIDNGEGKPQKRCFPEKITLEPSTSWKTVEISVPAADVYGDELNGSLYIQFSPPNSGVYVPNDDCVFVVIDKVQYLPGGGEIECEGKPCPEKEIEEKLKEIDLIIDGKVKEADSSCVPNLLNGKPNPDYPACQNQAKMKEREGIKDVVEGEYKLSNNKTQIEQIGIKNIIEKIVPSIFKDLSYTRETMKTCFYDPGGSSVAQSCELVRNEVGPDGKLISNCCFKECYMQDCLDSCFLKNERKEYKSCLFSCLAEKQSEENTTAKKMKTFPIKGVDGCRHSLNFYCCTER